MGKFDGILICSDIDGTLNCKGDTFAVNKEAVQYFTANGGKFAFATGRMADHIHQETFENIANAPVCLCNGSIVYDPVKRIVLHKALPTLTVGEILEETAPYLKNQIGRLHLYHPDLEGETQTFEYHQLDLLTPEIKKLYSYKYLFYFPEPENAENCKQFLCHSKKLQNHWIAKSWPKGVEVNSLNGTKGTALDYIKQSLGNIHTAIGIGDYENDIPLLMHADIGVAVGNAVPELKAVADLIVKPGTEYAVKDLIERLDKGEVILKK